VEDPADLTADFMRHSFGVASGDFVILSRSPQDGLGASKVDVSRGEIAQALVIAAMIDESVDLGLEVARQNSSQARCGS
jgi:hypothetical protein